MHVPLGGALAHVCPVLGLLRVAVLLGAHGRVLQMHTATTNGNSGAGKCECTVVGSSLGCAHDCVQKEGSAYMR